MAVFIGAINKKNADAELLEVGQILRLIRLPIFSRSGYIPSQREVNKSVKEIVGKVVNIVDVGKPSERIVTTYDFITTDKKRLSAYFVNNELAAVYGDKIRYEPT